MLVKYGALNRDKILEKYFSWSFLANFCRLNLINLQQRALDSEKQGTYDKASAPRDKGVLNFYI